MPDPSDAAGATPSTEPDPQAADRLLARREREIEEQLAALTRPVQDQGSISFGKRVGDGTAMAVDRLTAVRAHEQLTDLLSEIGRARAKVAEGSYGRCDVCGDEIPAGRLEARPAATRCLRHS